MADETVYSGPECKTCIGTLYKKVTLGASDWKRCMECKSLTPIKETDNLTPLDPQPE
ncbi:hypothetical protein pA_gene0065 [Vibrio phage 13VT501A]|nr:hypothetical protein pA_gene0065 [Vibrio phage 13VT501A]